MYYSITLISLIEVVLALVPALVDIAYVTVAERKTMASTQVAKHYYNSNNKRMFSTSTSRLIPNDDSGSSRPEGGLTPEQKQTVLDTLQNYEVGIPKPVDFQKPGYPDCKSLAETSKSHTEYSKRVEKFKDKYTNDKSLVNHHEEARRHVVERLCGENSGLSSKDVTKFLESQQNKDYASNDDPDIGGNYPKGEAEWRETVNYQALRHGRHLPSSCSDDWRNSEVTTPSVKYATTLPSDQDPSSPSDQDPETPSAQDATIPSVQDAPTPPVQEAPVHNTSSSENSDSKTSSPDCEDNKTPGACGKGNSSLKRPSTFEDENPSKKPRLDSSDDNKSLNESKQSSVDYIIEKESTENLDSKKQKVAGGPVDQESSDPMNLDLNSNEDGEDGGDDGNGSGDGGDNSSGGGGSSPGGSNSPSGLNKVISSSPEVLETEGEISESEGQETSEGEVEDLDWDLWIEIQSHLNNTQIPPVSPPSCTLIDLFSDILKEIANFF